MAVVGEQSLTIKDFMKRLGPDQRVTSNILEILNETNECLNDMKFLEANNITTHRTLIRSGLPAVYWRSLNRGVPSSKSRSIQVDDVIGMVDARSVVDAALADLNGQKPEFMLTEERPFIESMNQEVARTLFYGNLAENPAGFLGLMPRYSTMNPAKAANYENVIDAGGTGADLTSIWLVTWGDLATHMIYPKGLGMGLQREYLGRVPIVDPEGYTDVDGNVLSAEYMGYKAYYTWKLGLVVRDWRQNVRVANVDMSGLDNLIENGAATAAGQKLTRVMIKAYNQIPNLKIGKMAWYMNRDCKTMLDLMAMEKSNVNLTISTFEGEQVTTFKGIPIRQVDALGQEDQVTAA